MRLPIKLISAFAALTLSSAAFAADSYKIDPVHTWVDFKVNHGGWSAASGQFRTVSGDIVFDNDDVTKSSVTVVIDASSVDTNNGARDKHLASPDFFNSAEFPKITFESTSVTKSGDNTGEITGNLSMLGVSKPVTLSVTFNKAEGDKIGFSAVGELTPGDFGMAKVAGFGMGPNVKFTIELEAKK
ncbi:MAG: polyisoprenoid-binding protein [Hyphomicrobiales bacterium]|nr:MAG: polyisoprenoid-binding protein [Hyphomicrobiales bacterium]